MAGGTAWSYLRTSAGYVTDAVQESVPIEFQIDRARGMVQDLVPEVRKNMHVIAKEEVEVQRLDEQITDSQTRLGKEKDQLLRLKTDLATGKNRVPIRRAQLHSGGSSHRFGRPVSIASKPAEATLGSLKDIRAARQKSLVAARQKLEGMLASKRQLQVEVENLEARLQMITAAQATSNYQFRRQPPGPASRSWFSNLRSRLEVAEKLVNAEVYYHDEIPLDKTAPENIVEQVSEHFAKTLGEKVVKK